MQLFQCTCVGEKNDNHFWNCFSCRNISSLVMKMFDELLLAHQDIAKWSCENENSKQTIHLMKAEMESINKKRSCLQTDVSAAERRGTPVLLSSSVSNNSDNSPQMAVPRRSREIDQSTQHFHVGCDNRCLYLATNTADYMDVNF